MNKPAEQRQNLGFLLTIAAGIWDGDETRYNFYLEVIADGWMGHFYSAGSKLLVLW